MRMKRWLRRILAFVLMVTIFLQTASMNVYAATGTWTEVESPTDSLVNQAVGGESVPKNQENSQENSVETEDSTKQSSRAEISVSDGDAFASVPETVVSDGDAVWSEEAGVVSDGDAVVSDGDALMLFMAMPFAADTTFTTLEQFLQAVAEAGIINYEIESSGERLTSLTLPNDEIQAGKLLVLLSNTNPAVYQDARITIVSSIDLTQTVQGLNFAGLGRESAPFGGHLEANAGISPAITLNYSLFEAISQDATNAAAGRPIDIYFNYQYDASIGYVPLFARQVSDGTSGTISTWHFHVNNSGRIYGLIEEISGSQGIRINVTAHYPVDAEMAETATGTVLTVQPETGYAGGLICSTMTDGAKLVVGSITTHTEDTEDKELTGFSVSVGDNSFVGGLVGSMEQAELIMPEKEALSGTWTVSGSSGVAGGLVGYAQDSVIDLYQLYDEDSSITVSAPQGAAGVLAGSIYGGTLKLNQGWKVPTGGSYVISGKYVGELSGIGQNIAISTGNDAKVAVGAPVLLNITASGGSGGGLIGRYTLAGDSTGKLGGEITGDKYEITEYNISDEGAQKATVYCGGVFGTFIVKEGAAAKVSGLTVSSGPVFRQTDYYSVTGGLFGQLHDDASYTDADTRALTSVVIQDAEVNLELISDEEHSKQLGGLIGILGSASAEGNGIYLEVSTEKNSLNQIYIPHPHASNNGFGGVIAVVGNNCVVNLEDVAVSNKLAGDFWHGPDGAGLIAEVRDGAAVRLGGTIDISDVYYYHNKDRGSATGQLIGVQSGSLIYGATDLNLIRGEFISSVWALDTTGNRRLSDIGNYGEVVRMSDFITLDATTHRVSIASPITNGTRISLGSEEDFVKLAITMQSHGYFSGVTGITSANYATLYAKGIDLTGDIDLTGTGVYSLTRDTADNVKYTGDLQGLGGVKTITLATGEKWGKYEAGGGTAVDCSTLDLEGMGQIYSTNVRNVTGSSHNRIGLFGEISGEVSFKDVKLTGTMDFGSNMDNVYVGGLAAYAYYDWNTDVGITFENVTTEVTMTYGNADFGNNGWNLARVGGFLGGTGTLTELHIIDCVSALNLNYTSSGSFTKFGGLIGEIGGSNNAVITVTDTVLSNNIQYNMADGATAAWAMYGGGLIGFVYGNDTGTITLDGLQVKGQVIEGNVAGGTAGGILGYYWERTNVIFTGDAAQAGAGLSVEKSAEGESNILRIGNSSKSAVALGGLCCDASGYWKVEKNGISLKDFQVENNYGTIGLLLNRGLTGSQGIYLELTDAESYAVDSASVRIIKAENKGFDELIYDTTGGDKNRGGVISVATEERALIDMPGEERNTYQNRTKFGTSEEWNTVDAKSRYYYNLDQYRADSAVSQAAMSGILDSPEKVLLWSVYCYARDNVRKYFWNDASGSYTMSGEIDLTGYSYYPVRLEGSLTLLPGTTLVLNNQAIEEKEAQSPARSTWETSQHYTMHFGLLREITGSLIVGAEGGAAVTLKGNVGADGTNSGFLVGYQFGSGSEKASKQLRLYHVVLEDLYINGYDGTSVCPLLINAVGSYVDIDIKTLYTQNEVTREDGEQNFGKYEATGTDASWYAASSLFGKVGSSNGAEIALTMEDVRLDGRQAAGEKIEAYGTYRSIFSRATLLESFSYNDQSSFGIYNFVKAEDWNEDGTALHHVTYGTELSESVRNEDLQYQYYGEEYAVDAENYNNTDTENQHRFASGYLPYVKQGESGNNHEIDVNVKIYHLLEGCGTYGHPYSILQSGQIQTLADFISSGLAKKGWIVCYNQNKDFCKGDSASLYDKYYKYDGTEWSSCDDQGELLEEGDAIANETMLSYLSAAYYSLDADMTMSKKFSGLGTEEQPFHGVFVNNSKGAEGNKKYTITVTTEGGNLMTGLISVADGCVIKDIQIHFAPAPLAEQWGEGYKIGEAYGGVIAKVLRGDSVVDGVSVTYADGIIYHRWGFDSKLAVGGLVGVIESGGVILRNIAEDSGLRVGSDGTLSAGPSQSGDRSYEENYSYLYCNPYIGKVANGYVISQGCAVDNSAKNYEIAEFIPQETTELSLGAAANNIYPVTISGGNGLFAFSLIMSCGPASTHDEVGYVEEFRGRGEADYSLVGKAELTANHADYLASVADDEADGASYLIRTCTSGSQDDWKTLNSKQISVAFTQDCDVTAFGGSFRGIGFRTDYATNDQCKVTLAGENAISGLKAEGTTAKITYAMKTADYSDYLKLFKVSGLFNRAYTAQNAILHDLQICGSLMLDAYSGGNLSNSASDLNQAGGGLAGVLHSSSGVVVKNIIIGDEQADSFTIGKAAEDGENPRGIALYSVGGVVGLVSDYPLTMQDCVIQNSSIAAPYCAGGLVGVGGGSQLWNDSAKLTIEYTKDTTIENVTITTNAGSGSTSAVGALVGYARRGVTVGTSLEENDITLQNLNLTRNAGSGSNNVYVGGAIGYIEANDGVTSSVNNMKVQNVYLGDGTAVIYQETVQSGNYYGKTRSAVGGILGGAKGGSLSLNNCHFNSGTMVAGKDVGGLCGFIGYKTPSSVTNSSVASGAGNTVSLWGHDTVGGLAGTVEISNSPLTVSDLKIGTEGGELLGYVKYTENIENAGQAQYVGGIVGMNNTSRLIAQDVQLENMTLVAPRVVGGVVGGTGDAENRMEISNLSFRKSRLVNTGMRTVDMTVAAGGLLGNDNGTARELLGSNILLDANEIWHLEDDMAADNTWTGWKEADLSQKNKPAGTAGPLCQGNLVGSIAAAGRLELVAVTVQDSTIQGAEKPSQEVGSGTYTGYLVYADYLGACRERTEGSLPGVYPFVNYSPYDEAFLKVYESAEDTGGLHLYGDGVAYVEDADSGKQSVAQLIYLEKLVKQAGAGLTKDKLSFYNAEENAAGVDFPVFLMEEKKQTEVDRVMKAYLDLLTCDGASNYAVSDEYRVSINTYQMQDGKFVNIQDASLVYDESSKTFRTVAGKNDSGYNQFTLVTVTFKDPLKNNYVSGNTYTLYLPIIVKLPVEVSFHAAVVHDTVFLDEVFEEAATQVVAEYGAKATVRFAYEYVYSWGSVLETASSDSTATNPLDNAFKKAVNLYTAAATKSTVMPAGTRLTLVDPQRADKSYTAVLTEDKTVLDLDALFTEWDSIGLKELLHLEQITGTYSEGEELWVEVTPETEEEKEELLVFAGKYYRAATAEDTGVALYRFTCREEYILVMQFPKQGTNICNMEFNVPDRLGCERSDSPSLSNSVQEISDSAARKLFIYQAISHTLTKDSETLVRYVNDTPQSPVNVEGGFVALEPTQNTIVLELTDTIEGSLDYVNLLGDGDKRFVQFSVSLDEYTKDTAEDAKIKHDVLAEAQFTREDGSVIASYSMMVSGDSYELLFPVAQQSDGTNPVNLVDYLKEKKGTAKVHARISLTFFPDSSLESFPVAKVADSRPESYGRFSVTALLSEKEGLLAGTRTKLDTNMAGYYRASSEYAKLIFEADELSRLGINIASPGEKNLAESEIKGSGYIDASGIQEQIGRNMVCTLSLYQKQNDGSYLKVDMQDYLNRVTVNGEEKDAAGESVSWTLNPTVSYEGCYDADTENFVIPVAVAVRHDVSQDCIYANYRVELTVRFEDGAGMTHLELNPDYFVYTFAKISTDLLR